MFSQWGSELNLSQILDTVDRPYIGYNYLYSAPISYILSRKPVKMKSNASKSSFEQDARIIDFTGH